MRNYLSLIFSYCQLIGLLVLTFVLYGFFFFLSSISFEHSSAFVAPSESKKLIVVDAREEVLELMKNILIEGELDDSFPKFKKQLGELGEQRDYGIQWLQPIVYFSTEYKGKQLQGLIVQIANEGAWNRNINKLFGNVSAAIRQGKSGIVVQSSELNRAELYAFMEQQKNGSATNLPKVLSGKFLNIQLKNEGRASQLNVEIEEQAIQLNGFLDVKGKKINPKLNYALIPDGFHFTSDLVTSGMQDSISKALGKTFPLCGVSLNYKGVSIQENKGNILPVPEVDMILGFSSAYSIDSFLTLIPDWEWKNLGESIVFGKRTYYVKQVDETTIYLGVNKMAEAREIKAQVGVVSIGSFEYLTNVEANSFVKMALRMNPYFRLATNLSKDAKGIMLTIKPMGSEQYQLDAQLEFKGSKSTLSSLLLLMASQS